MVTIMIMIDRLIEQALFEDIHTGDITTLAVVPGKRPASAKLVAKEDLVAAGLATAARVFSILDPDIRFNACLADGEKAIAGNIMATVHGEAATLLMGERVALNLLQRMCGIATLTASFVEAVAGTKTRIVDTRKTTPGLRILEKYAVRVGGGVNHRTGLYDGVLIKENHITAAGGITEAIRRARAYIPHTLKIEIETETLPQVDEAIAAGADIIMLDNMTLEEMRAAVITIAGRAQVEASGGVNLERVRAIAETGVDIISVGALTHSPRAMDISMLLD
jgi:nicotinate-nucleotide pyrophosphorylase (carboxylating)